MTCWEYSCEEYFCRSVGFLRHLGVASELKNKPRGIGCVKVRCSFGDRSFEEERPEFECWGDGCTLLQQMCFEFVQTRKVRAHLVVGALLLDLDLGRKAEALREKEHFPTYPLYRAGCTVNLRGTVPTLIAHYQAVTHNGQFRSCHSGKARVNEWWQSSADRHLSTAAASFLIVVHFRPSHRQRKPTFVQNASQL